MAKIRILDLFYFGLMEANVEMLQITNHFSFSL